MGTITRFGKLGSVFKSGQSDLFNGIARLAVLYEDLRLEMGEFGQIYAAFVKNGAEAVDYRTMYYLRRSLSTLVEFRGALTTVRGTAEFKQAEASLPKRDAAYILKADQYLQTNWAQIKDLRNEFGSHIQMNGIKFALLNCDALVSRVTWNRSADGWTMGLECDFAGDLVAGAIGSKLQAGTDVLSELRKAIQIIADGFVHAQAATLGLVHAFLWDRFGL